MSSLPSPCCCCGGLRPRLAFDRASSAGPTLLLPRHAAVVRAMAAMQVAVITSTTALGTSQIASPMLAKEDKIEEMVLEPHRIPTLLHLHLILNLYRIVVGPRKIGGGGSMRQGVTVRQVLVEYTEGSSAGGLSAGNLQTRSVTLWPCTSSA